MDQIACMRAFIAVVETGGFTGAARRTHQSKALISKYVASLEQELGTRLLHRTTRRVSTTSSGQVYYERCLPLLEEFDELNSLMRAEVSDPKGELRVNAPTSFAELHLMGVVAGFVRRYPDIQVKMSLSDHYIDLVEEGVDVAIRIGELADSSLVARRLGISKMLLCAAPDYLRTAPALNQVSDLTRHECILDSNYRDGTLWQIGDGDEAERVRIHHRIEVSSARALLELLLEGQGIGYAPSFVVRRAIEEGRLIQLLPEIKPQAHSIYALYTHRKQLSTKVRLFIEATEQALSQARI